MHEAEGKLYTELRDRIVLREDTDRRKARKPFLQPGIWKKRRPVIILKWNKFGTTRCLPRAGRPGQTQKSGGSGATWQEGVTQNRMVTLAQLQWRSKFNPGTTISAELHRSGLRERKFSVKEPKKDSHAVRSLKCGVAWFCVRTTWLTITERLPLVACLRRVDVSESARELRGQLKEVLRI